MIYIYIHIYDIYIYIYIYIYDIIYSILVIHPNQTYFTPGIAGIQALKESKELPGAQLRLMRITWRITDCYEYYSNNNEVIVKHYKLSV